MYKIERKDEVLHLGALTLIPTEISEDDLPGYLYVDRNGRKSLTENPPTRRGYRIKAGEDIPEFGIEAGREGGFVESQFAIPQDPKKLWIEKGAFVLDNAHVWDGIHLGPDVWLCDNAIMARADKPLKFPRNKPNVCSLVMKGTTVVSSLDALLGVDMNETVAQETIELEGNAALMFEIRIASNEDMKYVSMPDLPVFGLDGGTGGKIDLEMLVWCGTDHVMATSCGNARTMSGSVDLILSGIENACRVEHEEFQLSTPDGVWFCPLTIQGVVKGAFRSAAEEDDPGRSAKDDFLKKLPSEAARAFIRGRLHSAALELERKHPELERKLRPTTHISVYTDAKDSFCVALNQDVPGERRRSAEYELCSGENGMSWRCKGEDETGFRVLTVDYLRRCNGRTGVPLFKKNILDWHDTFVPSPNDLLPHAQEELRALALAHLEKRRSESEPEFFEPSL